MATNGEILETQRIGEKVLRILPSKFVHTVVAIEESQDLSTMSLENLQGRFEARIFQRSSQVSFSHDQALKSQVTFTRDRGAYHGRGIGRGRERDGRHTHHQHDQAKENEGPKERK
ncbi:keratin, type I cytoskeletal 9-like [Dorcoceras hygrometricum]|uniref:Keratin, type I cytoskeletal 9-like n=1 Tax=Dorcoceras hygrometricum TaxID=472368 RepID=A0A2Z7AHD5_9LAMI|nr:keratin, type I cytoskeletal 9-like [Dorcoceras hygrometricum]